MKKLLTLLMAIVMMLGCFAGCNRQQNETFDDNKSHLYVGIYNAGFGVEWLKDIKTRYEKLYEKKQFEPGKEGIQIHISDINSGNLFIS